MFMLSLLPLSLIPMPQNQTFALQTIESLCCFQKVYNQTLLGFFPKSMSCVFHVYYSIVLFALSQSFNQVYACIQENLYRNNRGGTRRIVQAQTSRKSQVYTLRFSPILC